MKISPSLIFHMLSREIKLIVKSESFYGTEITMPFIIDDGNTMTPDTQEGILYICNNMKQLSKRPRSSDALLIVGTQPYDIETQCAYAFAPKTSAIDALYRTFEIMQHLQAWDNRLKDARHKGLPLRQVIPLVSEVFCRPLVLVDNQYNYIAYTESYFQMHEEMRPEVSRESSQEIMPRAALNDLILNKEFLLTDTYKGIKFYPRDADSARSMYLNFFQKDRYMARLLSPVGASKVSQGEKELFIHVSGYFKDIYFRRLDEQMTLRQNDSFHLSLKSMLLHEPVSSPPFLHAVLENSSWLEDHEYQIATIRLFSIREFELSALFHCAQLEDMKKNTVAFTIDTEIVWVINHSLHDEASQGDIETVIKQFLGDFACKAGISGIHSKLQNIHLLYRQAIGALRLGEERNPHYWFYRFEDYKIDYLMNQLTKEYPPDHTVHPGIEKLAASDRHKGTYYLKYLKSYIENGFNTSHAADRVFVHRSTFIRQLARIKDLSGIDLSTDSSLEELTHILISLELSNLS